jgi:hypothetical protein
MGAIRNLTTGFFIFSTLSALLANDGSYEWFGKSWKIKKLHCPFGCPGISKLYPDAKNKKVILEKEAAQIPVIGHCRKPNWKTLRARQVKEYLEEWSNNEYTKGKNQIRANLPGTLGLAPTDSAVAGVVRCSNDAFNFIYIHSKKAFILFEENSYWELVR